MVKLCTKYELCILFLSRLNLFNVDPKRTRVHKTVPSGRLSWGTTRSTHGIAIWSLYSHTVELNQPKVNIPPLWKVFIKIFHWEAHTDSDGLSLRPRTLTFCSTRFIFPSRLKFAEHSVWVFWHISILRTMPLNDPDVWTSKLLL